MDSATILRSLATLPGAPGATPSRPGGYATGSWYLSSM
jgi:hypothetical protein